MWRAHLDTPLVAVSPCSDKLKVANLPSLSRLQNGVLWTFLLSLCFIFRMREDNPYLMLDEDAGGWLCKCDSWQELRVVWMPC